MIRKEGQVSLPSVYVTTRTQIWGPYRILYIRMVSRDGGCHGASFVDHHSWDTPVCASIHRSPWISRVKR